MGRGTADAETSTGAPAPSAAAPAPAAISLAWAAAAAARAFTAAAHSLAAWESARNASRHMAEAAAAGRDATVAGGKAVGKDGRVSHAAIADAVDRLCSKFAPLGLPLIDWAGAAARLEMRSIS